MGRGMSGFLFVGYERAFPEVLGWRLMAIQKLERGLFGGKTMETMEHLWIVDSLVGYSCSSGCR